MRGLRSRKPIGFRQWVVHEKKLRKAEYEAGVEAGIELGERSFLKNQIRKKLKKGKSIEQIADELEEAVTTIQRIIEETKKEN